ncbi:hypothetical protein I317_03252 [Kwoniella heveanensis CBS 569]|nr:hypothetical protein I317_03252 [Kwoniella heveanensis CBS 569]
MEPHHQPEPLDVEVENTCLVEPLQEPCPPSASDSTARWDEMKTPDDATTSFDPEWSRSHNNSLPILTDFRATDILETPYQHPRHSFASGQDAAPPLALGPPPLLGLGIQLPTDASNATELGSQSNSYINPIALLDRASSLIVSADPPISMEGISNVPLLLSPDSEPNDTSSPAYHPAHRSRSTVFKRNRSSSRRVKSVDRTLGQSVREGLHGEQLLVQGDPVRFQFEIDKLRGFDTLKKEDTWVLGEIETQTQAYAIDDTGQGKSHDNDKVKVTAHHEVIQGEGEHPNVTQAGSALQTSQIQNITMASGPVSDASRTQSIDDRVFRDLFVPSARNLVAHANAQALFQSLTRPSSHFDQSLALPAMLGPAVSEGQGIPISGGRTNTLPPLTAMIPIAGPSAVIASPERQHPVVKERNVRTKTSQPDHIGSNSTILAEPVQRPESKPTKTVSVIRTLAQAKEAIETLQHQKRQMERERDWTWQALVWTNNISDAMMHPCDHVATMMLTGRLCGKFLSDPLLQPPPGYPALYGILPLSELYAVIAYLAETVGCKIPAFDNLARDPLTEQMFHRVLRTLLAGFDATSPLNDHTFSPDRIPSFTPPDVLWMLVHLADPVFVEPLTKAIRMALWASTDTQRGMVLLLLFGRIAGGKMRLGADSPAWAKQQVERWEQNEYRLLAFDDGLNRVNEEDVRSALAHLREKRRLEEVRQMNTGSEYVMAERKVSLNKGKARAGTDTSGTSQSEAGDGNVSKSGDHEGSGNGGAGNGAGEERVATRLGARGKKRVKENE